MNYFLFEQNFLRDIPGPTPSDPFTDSQQVSPYQISNPAGQPADPAVQNLESPSSFHGNTSPLNQTQVSPAASGSPFSPEQSSNPSRNPSPNESTDPSSSYGYSPSNCVSSNRLHQLQQSPPNASQEYTALINAIPNIPEARSSSIETPMDGVQITLPTNESIQYFSNSQLAASAGVNSSASSSLPAAGRNASQTSPYSQQQPLISPPNLTQQQPGNLQSSRYQEVPRHSNYQAYCSSSSAMFMSETPACDVR